MEKKQLEFLKLLRMELNALDVLCQREPSISSEAIDMLRSSRDALGKECKRKEDEDINPSKLRFGNGVEDDPDKDDRIMWVIVSIKALAVHFDKYENSKNISEARKQLDNCVKQLKLDLASL